MREAFKSLDADGNGKISKDELLIGYHAVYKEKTTEEIEAAVNELLERVDINEEGFVNFTDFIIAAVNREKLLHDSQIRKVFKIFDQDNNGFIEWEELKSTMSSVKIPDEDYRNMIHQFDKTGDGKVSFQIIL